MSFLGKHRHTLDTKGRVSVPAKFRSKILELLNAVDLEQVSLSVLRTQTNDGNCNLLRVYTDEALERDLDELRASVEDVNELEIIEDFTFNRPDSMLNSLMDNIFNVLGAGAGYLLWNMRLRKVN